MQKLFIVSPGTFELRCFRRRVIVSKVRLQSTRAQILNIRFWKEVQKNVKLKRIEHRRLLIQITQKMESRVRMWGTTKKQFPSISLPTSYYINWLISTFYICGYRSSELLGFIFSLGNLLVGGEIVNTVRQLLGTLMYFLDGLVYFILVLHLLLLLLLQFYIEHSESR